jgi:hypothetical protein
VTCQSRTTATIILLPLPASPATGATARRAAVMLLLGMGRTHCLLKRHGCLPACMVTMS